MLELLRVYIYILDKSSSSDKVSVKIMSEIFSEMWPKFNTRKIALFLYFVFEIKVIIIINNATICVYRQVGMRNYL